MRVEHDVRVCDSGENLEEIFVETGSLITGERTSHEKIAVVILREGIQGDSANVLWLSQSYGKGICGNATAHIHEHRRRILLTIGENQHLGHVVMRLAQRLRGIQPGLASHNPSSA